MANLISKNINDFFQDILTDLNCSPETKAYLISTFSKYKNAQDDLSNQSITVLYSQAQMTRDFALYQNVGDWLFYSSALYPDNLRFASRDYYDTIARLSYYSCYKLINRQWKLFDELASEYIVLSQQVRNKLIDLK